MYTFLLALLFALPTTDTPVADPPADKINWMTFEEAVEANKTEKRKIFIDVYTDWCGWCKRMDATTFSDPAVVKYMNEKYYAVKLDAEQKEDIEFDGRTFKYVPNGRRGYHELAATLMNGKMSYPTVVFLDENFAMLQPLPGYRKAEEFLPILTYLGGDHHKSTPWESYQKQYKAEQQTAKG